MTATTGVKQLDTLLGGGFRDRDRVLLYGPSFQGKEVLARQSIVANLHEGMPVIVILTNETVQDLRNNLRAMDPGYDDYEAKGLIWFIDAYSRSIGVEDSDANVHYVDSAVDLNGLSLALNKVQAEIIQEHDHHVLLMDSASTLVLYSNAQATFRFLQVLIGRARQAGAVCLLLLDHGMHSDAEVQMFRHLVDGVLESRDNKDRPQLKVEGLQVSRNPGWIDYKFSDNLFELTGSLAAGRIH